jgi:hypothetical protein
VPSQRWSDRNSSNRNPLHDNVQSSLNSSSSFGHENVYQGGDNDLDLLTHTSLGGFHSGVEEERNDSVETKTGLASAGSLHLRCRTLAFRPQLCSSVNRCLLVLGISASRHPHLHLRLHSNSPRSCRINQ